YYRLTSLSPIPPNSVTYTLSLHDALPICPCQLLPNAEMEDRFLTLHTTLAPEALMEKLQRWAPWSHRFDFDNGMSTRDCAQLTPDRKSTRLNSSHVAISYAVFCLKKKKQQ